MPQRINIASHSPYEPAIGFSRAVRIDSTIYVSGTTAIGPDGKLVGVGDMYAQAVQALKNIEAALAQAGATLKDVVQTRAYVTEIDRWQEVAKAHKEFLADVRPAMTLVEVSRLVDPQMLVEIEALAVVS